MWSRRLSMMSSPRCAATRVPVRARAAAASRRNDGFWVDAPQRGCRGWARRKVPRQRRTGLLLARSLVDASSSFAPADREKCREDAAALADVLATDDLPLVRMDAALLLAAPIPAGDGVVQRLAGDDDPDVSEAGFNALKARARSACATTVVRGRLRVAVDEHGFGRSSRAG